MHVFYLFLLSLIVSHLSLPALLHNHPSLNLTLTIHLFPHTGGPSSGTVYLAPCPGSLTYYAGPSARETRRIAAQTAPIPASLHSLLESRPLNSISMSFDPKTDCEHSPSGRARSRMLLAFELYSVELADMPMPKLLDGRNVRLLRDDGERPVCLGEGAFGCVLMGQLVHSGQLVAIKLFKRNSKYSCIIMCTLVMYNTLKYKFYKSLKVIRHT